MLLSRAECVKILKNALQSTAASEKEEQATLLDYQLVSDPNAVGYLGDYYALTLEYATLKIGRQQRQLFVKAVPQKSAEVEKEAIFQKEAWLYESLLSEMQQYSSVKWCANCFYTRADLCVLEDIRLSGYRAAPATKLDESQMRQLLRSLAAFHAASFVYEQRQQIDIGGKFGEWLKEITVAPNIAWFTTGLSAVLAVLRSLPRYQTSDFIQFIGSQLPGIVERIYAQTSASGKYRNVLCHRDTWAGNIFFDSAPHSAAILLDFQTCRFSPPAVDLIFSLYMNLTTDERRNQEQDYIDIYYAWLAADLAHFGLQMERFLSKAELLESYSNFRLFGAVYRAVATTVTGVPREYVTNDFKYVDRSAVILKYMEQNEEFRASMSECCEEVMEVASTMK